MSVKVRITESEVEKYKKVFGLNDLPAYGESFKYEGIEIVNLTSEKNINEPTVITFVVENIDAITVGVISSAIFSLATYSVKSILKLNNNKTDVSEEKITKKLSREFDVNGEKYTEEIKYEETYTTTKKRV